MIGRAPRHGRHLGMSASLHETEEHSSAAQTSSSSATEEQGRWYCSGSCPLNPFHNSASVYLINLLSDVCNCSELDACHKGCSSRPINV